MNIVVFIKQVPDTDDVKWTANNNIDRANTESILNPLDSQALECSICLKNKYNAKVTAVSMGPNKAIEVLKEAIAMGVEEAVLLSDSKFVGSDTCATSKVLASSIWEKFPNTDLILFGQSASDGETSQTGPSVAVRLNYPFAVHVNEITEISDGYVTVNCETEQEKAVLKVKLPAVLCINNSVYTPSLPKIDGYIKAHDYNYKTYNIYELKVSQDETGVKGSPTYVSKVYKTKDSRDCKMTDTNEILKVIREASYGT